MYTLASIEAILSYPFSPRWSQDIPFVPKLRLGGTMVARIALSSGQQGGKDMEIEKIKMSRLMSAMKGLRNKGLIQISEDKKTGNFVVIVGRGIHRQWGVFNLPQGLWQITCKKEEVKEAVDRLLTEQILTD
jgi:hypothetical protein